MSFAGPEMEGVRMRQHYTHPMSIQEWTSDAHEGLLHTANNGTSFAAPSYHEVSRRAKTTRKPLRSSPLAGPALSGDRSSTPTDTKAILPSRSSSLRLSRPRSFLLAEPLSCFLRSKSSQSVAGSSSEVSAGSSSHTPSAVPPIHSSPSQSPLSLNQNEISARYQRSVLHASASNTSTRSTAINESKSSGDIRPRRLTIDTTHSAITRPRTVIISPTSPTFRPHSATIYTSPSSNPPSSADATQPLTPPPPPRSRLRLGERSTLDTLIRASDSASTSSSRTTIAELSPSTSAIRQPPPARPKSILKSPSASRHSSGNPDIVTAPGQPPVKDNSWYVNSPYTITPPFTRLGLNAPGVVLPLTVKEYRRRTAMAALTGGGVEVGEPDAAKGGMSRRASAAVNDASGSSTTSSLRKSRHGSLSTVASSVPLAHEDTQLQYTGGGSRTDEEVAASVELPENTHIPAVSSAALTQPDAQPHWPISHPDLQSQSHVQYDQEPNPGWMRAQSQSSAASSVSSLPLTLPSSVPDSMLLSQTSSMRSATETSSVCTSIVGTGIDDKSEETALPHGAHMEVQTQEAEAEAEVATPEVPEPVLSEIPTLKLKKKRKSVLAKMKSLCWTGTGPGGNANKSMDVQHGSTDVVNLSLPVTPAPAPTERPSRTRRSMPMMDKSYWNQDSTIVPGRKANATLDTVEKVPLEVPAAPMALDEAAVLPTTGGGNLQRLANRSGNEKIVKDAGVGVEVRYIDVGIVSDSNLRKSQAVLAGQRRSGSVRKVWDSLRGSGRRGF